LFGIVADRWLNAERVLGLCHVIGALALIWASTLTDYSTFYIAMLLNSFFFMPTIALNNTVSYIILEKGGSTSLRIFLRSGLGTVVLSAHVIVDLTVSRKAPFSFI